MNRVCLLIAALAGCGPASGSTGEDAGASRDSDILSIVRGGIVDIALGGGHTQVEITFYEHTTWRHPAANASPDAGSPECSEQVPECGRSVMDGCAVFVCSWDRTWRCPMTTETIHNPSAGTLTLSGGDRGPLVMPPPGLGTAIVDEPFERWTLGQEIGISATGAMVPAFTGRVRVPAAVDLMPAVMVTSLGVTRTDPIKLSWTPSAEGVVEFGVKMSDFQPDAEHLASAVCTAPAAAGMMEIPALRSLLGAASGYSQASMYVRRYQQVPVQAGDFAVQITVEVGPTLRFLTPVR